MLHHPDFDPIAISLGPLKIHWYGLMYLVGFLAFYWLGTLRAKRPGSGWKPEEVGDLLFYGALGVILGGRLGYVLFYDLAAYLDNPLNIFKIWQGGMSFHGGLIGVIIGMALFARRTGRNFFQVSDYVAPLVPIGYGAGRIGNFINGELWGRVTDVPWGMIFPSPNAGPLPRHPSQLYQAFLGGAVIFTILWLYTNKPRPTAAASGLFLVCFGTYRFIVEFFREPDAQLGFIAFDWLTMGQLLSLPLIPIGIALMAWAHRKARTH
jgi:phosphatidylglycerol---prolipoprotein diacylglyceryl transferase